MLFSLNRSRTPRVFVLWLAAWVLAVPLCAAQGQVTNGPIPDPVLVELVSSEPVDSATEESFPATVVVQQEASDEATQTYPVKGVVLDSVTGQPVARALVDSHESAVLTDNDGRFELSLPEGMVQISVKRPGYGSRGRSSNHMVRVGPSIPELTFNLTPEALITGQITLSTSDPADGIRVMAYRRRVVNGRMQWMMASTARTNSDGVFRITGLQPGDYLVYTQPTREFDGTPAQGAGIYGYPSAYYPGVADVASAGVLTLSAGQHAQADFMLARQEFYQVTVTVANREVGGGMNLQVHDRSGRPAGLPVRWNAQQGTAEVNVPNGSYFLEGRHRGESQLYGRVEFTVAGAPVTGLNMALVPLHAVPVTVRKAFSATSSTDSGGVVLADTVPENGSSAGLNISLIPADEFFGQMGATGGLHPAGGANDGSSFEIDNVTPGRYWVETSAFEGYVSSIASGGVDLAREPLTVGAGGSTAPIEVTLRDDTGTISAQVVSGSAGEQSGNTAVGEQHEIYVYAIPLFASSGPIRMSGLQGSGEATLSGLAPGSYRVVAFDAPQEIDFHTPEGLAKYAGMGETTSVDAGGSAHVQLDVIHTGNTETE
ncbi:MAG TPA: carboxypeptidase-like regulatory domain-containing protein [Silvibacterium sp.]|nr:carboxypeptidase-like regulatory domain-containing protein [Silvibacterium sp.]